jgi:hypothetical protein
MPDHSLDQKMQAIQNVTNMFWIERFVYLGIILLCLVILITTVAMALFGGEESISNTAFITSMFGSGGMITTMTGRILHMYNRSFDLLQGITQGDKQ